MKKAELVGATSLFLISLILLILPYQGVVWFDPLKLYLNPIVVLVHVILLQTIKSLPEPILNLKNPAHLLTATILLGWTISGFIAGYLYFAVHQRIKKQIKYGYQEALKTWGHKSKAW